MCSALCRVGLRIATDCVEFSAKNHMGSSDPKTVELAVRIVSYLACSSLDLLLNHADDPDNHPDNEFN